MGVEWMRKKHDEAIMRVSVMWVKNQGDEPDVKPWWVMQLPCGKSGTLYEW